MKTRKIFGYGIAVIFAFVLALAFTACEEAHTHSYSTAWSYDATQHWHECTDNDGAKTDVANHNYNAASVCPFAVMTEKPPVRHMDMHNRHVSNISTLHPHHYRQLCQVGG